MIRKTNFYFFILLFFVVACSSDPKNTKNSCKIFEDRYLWYKHTKKVEEKWGVPIYIQLAFVKKESDFKQSKRLLKLYRSFTRCFKQPEDKKGEARKGGK